MFRFGLLVWSFIKVRLLLFMPFGLDLSSATFVTHHFFIGLFSCFRFIPQVKRYVTHLEIISLIMMMLFINNPLCFVIILLSLGKVDYF